MHKRSLNSEVRKKEMLKITIENQQILKRLQDKTSNYSAKQWEDDFRVTEKRLKSMCEYPFALFTDPKKRADSRGAFQTADPFQSTADKENLLTRGPQRVATAKSGGGAHRTLNGTMTEGMPLLMRQAECLDENRIVLFKKGLQLGQGYFIVEISTNNQCLFIAAYDVESPESLLIELPEKKAEEIMKEFNSDYDAMASCLQVLNKRLVLLNPVSHQRNLNLLV